MFLPIGVSLDQRGQRLKMVPTGFSKVAALIESSSILRHSSLYGVHPIALVYSASRAGLWVGC